ncbi:hypothetical protein ACQEU5_06610 [Marinactinospora thermotolerans]|uniref:hypothetical protein n=1 Tax=Marinactinospora thermotolerans TaxID=531310 RepID=UPI003D906F90
MPTGVVLGVAIGEVTAVALRFTGGVAVAGVAFVGMLAATAVIARPLPVLQAGASAVPVVATQDQQGGIERLGDALVGGGLALLVSQVLFTPGPWTRAIELTRAVLGRLDEGVRRAVEAVEEGSPGRAAIGVRRIRAAQLDLAAATEARDSGRRMTRLTLRGWGHGGAATGSSTGSPSWTCCARASWRPCAESTAGWRRGSARGATRPSSRWR